MSVQIINNEIEDENFSKIYSNILKEKERKLICFDIEILWEEKKV